MISPDDSFQVGIPAKKTATNDKLVTIVTTSGKLQGSINLNFSSVQVNRVSDLFNKGNIAFLPLYKIGARSEKNILLNVKDIAAIIPNDIASTPTLELRKDRQVTVTLKYGLGSIAGKTNLMGETQEMDRISDLLNFPGKKWLLVYDAKYDQEDLNAVIINLDFISTVED